MTTPLSPIKRELLWSDLDAAAARRRRRWTYALCAAVVVGSVVLWQKALVELDGQSFVRAVGFEARTLVDRFVPECYGDDDCALRPSLITCCGSCPPARPFEAIAVSRLELILRDAADACAPTTRLCDPPVCPDADPDIEARAVCTAGRCRVIELPPSAWLAFTRR